MKKRLFAAGFFASFVLIGLSAAIFLWRIFGARTVIQKIPAGTCGDLCSLVVEPDDGIAPLLNMIRNATRSIDLVMYELEDTSVELALARAEARGVSVRVLLTRGYDGKPFAPNAPAFAMLRDSGVPVRWTSAHFTLTHEKSFVIDGALGFIMTFNLVPKYYPTGRDFGIIDRNPRDVEAMESVFGADWNGAVRAANSGDDLVWSPDNSRTTLLSLIDSASHSLEIYNEEMTDDEITAAIERAAQRGVAVRIVMTYSASWKRAFRSLAAAGAMIRTYSPSAHLYIHVKMIIADGARSFLGSENFSATSLNFNRELGLMISNPVAIHRLENIFEGDWKGAVPFG